MFIFITFITTFRYHAQIHLNKLQPESCPCIQESISKNNHENRAKNGKFFTVELAQKASQPLKFSPLVPVCGTEKKLFWVQIYHKRCSSQASFPAIHDENGQQNGKFFTVASAPFLRIGAYKYDLVLDYETFTPKKSWNSEIRRCFWLSLQKAKRCFVIDLEIDFLFLLHRCFLFSVIRRNPA